MSSRHAQAVERLRRLEFVIHAIDANLLISNENTFVGFIHSKMTAYQFLTGRKKSSKIDRGRNFNNMFSAFDQEIISECLLLLQLIIYRRIVSLRGSLYLPGSLPEIMPFFPVFRRGEGGHEHLLVGSYVQTLSMGFSLIGRETIPLKRCLLIGCHISIKLPVKKSG